jgi:hypothetical protein
MKGRVHKPFYDVQGRKYMQIVPEGSYGHLVIKIPFRYNRVMCKVGLKIPQEFQEGDQVNFEYNVKVFDGERFLVMTFIEEGLRI